MKKLKPLVYVFPVLFTAELVFGFAGTVVMIHGIAIRHILFILSFLSLYSYFFYYLLSRKIPIFSTKRDSYFGGFSKMDVCAVVFELSLIIWMTVIPYIMGTSLNLAKSEVFDSAAIFSLYFPIAFLIKKGEFPMKKFQEFLKWLVFAFAVLHLFFYFGQEYVSNTFINDIFVNIQNLLHGNSITPRVVLGHGGYTRVMFTTSIYLIVGIYLFLKNNARKWYDYVIFVIEILAVLATVTKSVWLGIGIAFIIFAAVSIVYFAVQKNKKGIRNTILISLIVVATVFISDQTFFNHIFTIRMTNAFVTSTDEEESSSKNNGKKSNKTEKEQELEEIDREGAAESNSIKIEQIFVLLDKWTESPIIGFGFGSYVEDYLRSEEAPFSYEMQLFALLMKQGIVGVAIWIVFFVVLFVQQVRNRNKYWPDIFAWGFLVLADVICVQTNPLLISFTGMSVVLYMVLIAVYDTEGKDVKKL